jgi:hypothetical protein
MLSAAPYRRSEETSNEVTGYPAEELGLDHATRGRRISTLVDIIYDGCAAGGLKHVRLGHRTIRLRRDWLDAWAEGHTRVAK